MSGLKALFVVLVVAPAAAPWARAAGDDCIQRGLQASAAGDLDAAERIYVSCLADGKGSAGADALRLRGNISFKRGDSDEAIRLFKRAVSSYHSSGDHEQELQLAAMTMSLLEATGDPAEGARYLQSRLVEDQRASRSFVVRSNAWLRLGGVQLRSGAAGAARSSFQRSLGWALAGGLEIPVTYAQLGIAESFLAEGNKATARHLVQDVIESGLDDLYTREMIDQLQRKLNNDTDH